MMMIMITATTNVRRCCAQGFDTLSQHCRQQCTNSRHQQFVTWPRKSTCPQCVVELASRHPSDVRNFEVVSRFLGNLDTRDGS